MLALVVREFLRYVELGEGLVRLRRTPLDPDYRATVQTQIQNREANFLALTRALLENPAHPYSQLFEVAGCAYADLEAGVRRDGLEPTLEALLREGLYLTLDEFRCRTEIVRAGRHIRATMQDWDLSVEKGPMQMMSSGTSGGKSLRTHHSLASTNFSMAASLLMRDEFVEGEFAQRLPRGMVMIAPILPSPSGLGGSVACARLGMPSEAWFAMAEPLKQSAHYRAMIAALVTRLRLSGAKIPYPRYIHENDFSPVAEFIARRKREGIALSLGGMVSSVTRVAGAALDHGFDIQGTFAFVSGESLTDVKRELIESAGMVVYPAYATSDFGSIGSPCRRMNTGNCVHVARPSLALIGRPVENPFEDGEPVASLHVTNLLPFAPRRLINVEIGDTGIIEPATCDCSLYRMGYTQQVRDIAAISKICGQGSTLYAREIVQLLEEQLPRQFAGRPGDFQLIEVEGAAQTDLVLRIHPRLGVESADSVLEYFLAQCRKTYGGTLAVRQWTESRGIRAELKPPFLASSGKFRAIRLLGPGIGAAAAPGPVQAVR